MTNNYTLTWVWHKRLACTRRQRNMAIFAKPVNAVGAYTYCYNELLYWINHELNMVKLIFAALNGKHRKELE
jgi:hypothetical protein